MAELTSGRPIVVGTAGHIDHGKTALIRALTGINTDRLPEEQARGMTIDLGFAYMDVGAQRVGIVDVPGHERFVRTMVAGATGIDMVLLLVAADDSVMPQTREHVEILDLLGVERGVVVINKIDLVEPSMADLVAQEVQELLAGTSLDGSAIVRVSAVTGAGLDELRERIGEAVGRFAAEPAAGPFRIPIDRVFTIAGRGTVVTGTVRSGRLRRGEPVVLLPSGRPLRVRGMQSHGQEVETIQRGQRAALNLAGISTEEIQRGDELASDGYFEPSAVLDVELSMLRSAGRGLRSQGAVRLLLGTREEMARVVLLERSSLGPGARGLAQLRVAGPVVASFGQRFIVRDETATRTIGGGRVLRPVARRLSRRHADDIAGLQVLQTGSAEPRVAEVVRYAGFQVPSPEQLAVRAGLGGAEEVRKDLAALTADGTLRRYGSGGDDTVVHQGRVQAVAERLELALRRFHQDQPLAAGMPEGRVLELLGRWGSPRLAGALLEELVGQGLITRRGGLCCLQEFRPALKPQLQALQDQIVQEIAAGGFQPPSVAELHCAKGRNAAVVAELTALAVAEGRLVPIHSELHLAADVLTQLKDTVRRLVGQNGSVTVSELRMALGSTRKYVVPFCEYLDSIHFTRRIGEKRVLADAAKTS